MSVVWERTSPADSLRAAAIDAECHATLLREAKEQGCFLCGEELSLPCIHWMGCTATIFLHPDCVKELMVALCRDVDETKNPSRYLPRKRWLAPFERSSS